MRNRVILFHPYILLWGMVGIQGEYYHGYLDQEMTIYDATICIFYSN